MKTLVNKGLLFIEVDGKKVFTAPEIHKQTPTDVKTIAI